MTKLILSIIAGIIIGLSAKVLPPSSVGFVAGMIVLFALIMVE